MEKKFDFNSVVKIGNRLVGDGHPLFVTAEAGSNHNGSLEQAYKLIDIAAEAKADAVKFQTFKAEEIYAQTGGEADYLKAKKSIFQIIKEMEMPLEWIPKLYEYANKKGIMFFSAPFDEESVDALGPYVPVFKIASYESTHIPLIKYIAKKQKPIIMSIGATKLEELEEALEAIYETGNKNVIIMNCVASYPAPHKDSNLKVIKTLKEKYSIPAGQSDHTRHHLITPLGALAVGGNILEKHFTISNKLEGPDHKFAVEPHELKELVYHIRRLEKVTGDKLNEIKNILKEDFRLLEEALGDGIKRIMPSEEELRVFARRSILSIKSIKKGEKLTKENLRILRPGKIKPGLEPKHWEEVLGKTAARDINEFTGIQKEDFI